MSEDGNGGLPPEPPDQPPIPYGHDHPDTDQWVDRDGRIYRGHGPYYWLRHVLFRRPWRPQ